MLVCMCVLVSVFVCVTGYLRYQEMLLRRTDGSLYPHHRFLKTQSNKRTNNISF